MTGAVVVIGSLNIDVVVTDTDGAGYVDRLTAAAALAPGDVVLLQREVPLDVAPAVRRRRGRPGRIRTRGRRTAWHSA